LIVLIGELKLSLRTLGPKIISSGKAEIFKICNLHHRQNMFLTLP